MHSIAHHKLKLADLALAAATTACGGFNGISLAQTGQPTLEIHAQLDASGVGGITQMPDGRVVIGYHPFYSPKIQVALLNADRKSSAHMLMHPYDDIALLALTFC